MNLSHLKTIAELSAFLEGSQAVAYSLPADKTSRYAFIQSVLKQFHYRALNKSDKGVVIRFLLQATGYSRQQLTRLINLYQTAGCVQRKPPLLKHRFTKKYGASDVRLLAEMDTRYATPSGGVIKKLCERAFTLFDQAEYESLAGISVSHLYNLRQSAPYKRQRQHFEKTQSRQNNLGERRKPQPNQQPGYIRVDTVHQGDQDGVKGVYHINAVDEETQYEVVLSCCKISEHFLLPILKEMLRLFPFKIKGFHADNGSEYINHHVVKLLNKLEIELTKSRPRHSNDNALAESKNASVVRKTFGYNHIQQKWADDLNHFNRQHLIPFLNYHRPCYFPTLITDSKGKQKKQYRYDKMTTPYEKLKSLEKATTYLKEGISFDQLDQTAYAINDNEAADRMNQARSELLKRINNEQKTA